MAATGKSKKSTAPEAFNAEERAAMKERAKEAKAARAGADGEQDVLDKMAEMSDDDKALAQAVHEIVRKNAPELTPRSWYGQPAYAKDGKVLVFFQASAKFKTRYCTLGFSDVADLDDGRMWPTSYALTALTEAEKNTIADLVRRAAR